jgi:hypothetical protein
MNKFKIGDKVIVLFDEIPDLYNLETEVMYINYDKFDKTYYYDLKDTPFAMFEKYLKKKE